MSATPQIDPIYIVQCCLLIVGLLVILVVLLRKNSVRVQARKEPPVENAAALFQLVNNFGERTAITGSGVRIGGGRQNDTPLPEENAGDQLAYVAVMDQQCWLQNKSEPGAVLVNDQPVSGIVALNAGDHIVIGDTQYFLVSTAPHRDSPQSTGAPDGEYFSSAPGPAPVIPTLSTPEDLEASHSNGSGLRQEEPHSLFRHILKQVFWLVVLFSILGLIVLLCFVVFPVIYSDILIYHIPEEIELLLVAYLKWASALAPNVYAFSTKLLAFSLFVISSIPVDLLIIRSIFHLFTPPSIRTSDPGKVRRSRLPGLFAASAVGLGLALTFPVVFVVYTGFIPGQTGATRSGEVSETAVGEQADSIRMENGLQIEIPQGALTSQQTLSVGTVDDAGSLQPQSGQLIADIYEIDFEQETFEKPIEIIMPYDEDMLPNDRSEGELYAAFYQDGQWQRAFGEIDPENNVIRITTYHASIWSILLDNLDQDGLIRTVQAYRCLESVLNPVDVPKTRAEADALVEQRLLEFDRTLMELDFEIEELHEKTWDHLPKEIGYLTLDLTLILVERWGVDTAVVTIGGVDVLGWSGPAIASIHLFDVSMASGEVISAMTKFEYAYQNYMAAAAIQHLHQYQDIKQLPDLYLMAILGVCRIENSEDEPEVIEVIPLVGTYADLKVHAEYKNAQLELEEELDFVRRVEVTGVKDHLVSSVIHEDIPEDSFVWSADNTIYVFDLIEKQLAQSEVHPDDWVYRLVNETGDQLFYEMTREYGRGNWNGHCSGKSTRDRYSGLVVDSVWECNFYNNDDGKFIGMMTYEAVLQEYFVP